MSRARHFIRGLGASYLSIAVAAVTVAVSVPLALHYLSNAEFGVWVVVTQVSNYLLMIEFGTSGSGVRLLMDHKDDPAGGSYGVFIKTIRLIQFLQGVLILAVGAAATPFLAPLLDVPPGLVRDFQWLWLGQIVLLAVMFVARIWGQLLAAHHRYDVVHLSTCVGGVVTLLVTWVAFRLEARLYSFIIGQAVGNVFALVITIVGAKWLVLLPTRSASGRVSRAAAKQLFRFGGELFFLSLGLALLGSSQAPIITRAVGFEAAAIWSVATKLFTMAHQVVGRLFDSSSSSLSEMVVRSERERLLMRVQDVFALSAAVALWAATTASVCNGPLLDVWTRGRIAWPWYNDVLMGAVLASLTITRLHIGFAGTTKQLRGLQFVYFAEGVVFVALAYVAAKHFGLSGILASALVADILGAGVFGARRTAAEFGISAFTAGVRWIAVPLRGGIVLIALAALIGFVTRELASFPALIARGLTMGILGAAVFWRLLLTARLRDEMRARWARFRTRKAA